MSAAAFTPGPWVWLDQGQWLLPASQLEKALGFSIDERHNREHYALVIARPGTWGWAAPGEREANARLIATSPDMHNVLTLLLATEPDDADGMADVYADANAALAKARGQ